LTAAGRVHIFYRERRTLPDPAPAPVLREDLRRIAAVIGLLGTANALAQVIAAPLIGRFSDRYGRRPLLLLGTFAGFACFLMLGLARSLALVFASRIINGLLGGNISLAQAYITDVTDEKSRARSLGIIGAAFGIGFVIGPALGGLLSGFGYGVPALVAAGLSLVNFVWIAAALPESLSAERRSAFAMNPRPPITARALFEALRKPRVGPLLHTQLFYALAFGVFTASFSLYALERLGLAARFSEQKLIVAGVSVLALALLAWGFVPNVPLLLVVLAPMAVAAGVLGTVLNSALIMGWLATFTWRKLLRGYAPAPAPGA
jgi:DHA1 family tetracycline resistance protein-like MFS transporter